MDKELMQEHFGKPVLASAEYTRRRTPRGNYWEELLYDELRMGTLVGFRTIRGTGIDFQDESLTAALVAFSPTRNPEYVPLERYELAEDIVCHQGQVLPDLTDTEWAFCEMLELFMGRIHANARNKGFHDMPRSPYAMLFAVHTEVSEMGEAIRDGNPESSKIGGFSSAAEEGADVIIRLLDFHALRGDPIAEAIIAKMRYNRSRPNLHNKAVPYA